MKSLDCKAFCYMVGKYCIIIVIVFINQMIYNIFSVTLEVLYDYGRYDKATM